jgi:large subunit ribosomal protein L28
VIDWWSGEGGCYAHPSPELKVLERVMAAVCEVCGKKPSFGMSISHSHVRSKRRWNPNIQRIRAIVNGSPRRLHVCTSCIKAGKVQKAVR